MSKFESPTRSSSDDSVFTLRISKRAIVEVLVTLGIIALLVLLGIYESNKRTAPPGSRQQVSATPQAVVVPTQQPVKPNRSASSRSREKLQESKDSPLASASAVNYPGEGPPVANLLPPAATTFTETDEEARVSNIVAFKRPSPVPVLAQCEDDGDDRADDIVTVARVDLPAPAIEPITLNGAGATFPYPLYAKWFAEYHTLHPQVTVNYQSKGSGAGIRQVTEGTIDFGASDVPMTDQQLKEARGKRGVDIIYIPTVLNAVAITYNLPGIRSALRFTPDLLADIFLGTINRWDDPRISSVNPGLQLPDVDIIVVHRTDASGTTYILADYLSKVSSQWKDRVGNGASVQWPTGMGQQGNEAVANLVRQMPGAIGYVDFIYARQTKLEVGSVLNASRRFVPPSVESVKAAADFVATIAEDDFRVSITNAPGENAYPIASFTWLLVPSLWTDANKKITFLSLMTWALDHSEPSAATLGYPSLPKAVSLKVKKRIRVLWVREKDMSAAN